MRHASTGPLTEGAPLARDELLAAELRDQIRHDRRSEHLDLDVRVHGQVAHVRGDVGSEEEREWLRHRLRAVGGLYAVWDLLTVRGAPVTVVDLGCGGTKQVAEAVGIDRVPAPGVDLVAELEAPLPLADESVDHAFAVHVLEHIVDLTGLMDELHRVLRPGGILHVIAPYWRHVNAVADPTHVRLMDIQTFKHWCKPARARRWHALISARSHDNVYADLTPVKGRIGADEGAVNRWFD